MNKFLQLVLVMAGAMAIQPAMAQSSAPAAAPAAAAKPAAVKKPVKAKPAAAPAKEVPAAEKSATIDDDDDDGKTPDTAASIITEFNCDHAQKITFYQNPGDDQYVAIRWNKQILRMKRVATSTGADRFENKRYGLIWIGIPAKSMLLDSKKGQQLANECRSPQQAEKQAKDAAKG